MNPIKNNISILKCIRCGSNNWDSSDTQMKCQDCGHVYRFDEKDRLVVEDLNIKANNWEVVSAGFDLLKGNEKPIKIDKLGGPRIKDLRNKLGINGVAINLGSGKDTHPDFINIDLGTYEHVHLVADLQQVPLIDESVELVVSNSVLEHIYDYQTVIDEAYRILKKGGYFYLCVPNFCIRHHKYDYHRWTTPGLHKLFDNRYEIIDSGACRGIAYALITYVEALICYKIKNRFFRAIARGVWRTVSKVLFLINDESNEDYQALSQTIYVLGKKL